MDKQERLRACLGGEETDRIPCGFWHHFPHQAWFGQATVDIHQRFYEQTQVDILKMMNEYPYAFHLPIETTEDWKKVKPLDVRSHYAEHMQEVRALRRRLGHGVPLFATVHGLLVSACHATDGPGHFPDPDNTVTAHLKEDPQSVAKGLETVAQGLGDLCDAFYDAGVDGIYYAALGGEEHRFSQELFETYVKPLEIAVLARAKERGIVILHICKDQVRLPMYRGYPADVVNWAIHECRYGLKEGRELFPDITLLGGFDDRSGPLVDGSDEDLKAKLHAIVAEAGTTRLILGADCTLPEDVSYPRIRTVVEAAQTLAGGK